MHEAGGTTTNAAGITTSRDSGSLGTSAGGGNGNRAFYEAIFADRDKIWIVCGWMGIGLEFSGFRSMGKASKTDG